MMTPEEHQAEHKRLHRALDELLACFIQQAAGSIRQPIIDLLSWAYTKTLAPSPADEVVAHSAFITHENRAADFESERQILLLALAELLLSRPGFELPIRTIAKRLRSEPMLDEFMRINRDRVSPAGRKPLL